MSNLIEYPYQYLNEDNNKMTDGLNIWNVGDDIIVDLFVADPNTGQALTGQSGYITLTIEKRSNSRFWNGSSYVVSIYNLLMSEVDATNSPGLYRYVLDGTTGNAEAEQYFMHANISNPPTIEGDDYSTHVSREVASVNVYESEPRVIA